MLSFIKRLTNTVFIFGRYGRLSSTSLKNNPNRTGEKFEPETRYELNTLQPELEVKEN